MKNFIEGGASIAVFIAVKRYLPSYHHRFVFRYRNALSTCPHIREYTIKTANTLPRNERAAESLVRILDGELECQRFANTEADKLPDRSTMKR